METNFWPIFWILLGGGVLATLAVLPYSLALNPQGPELLRQQLEARGSRVPPMLIIIATSTVQAGLLIALAVFAGL